MLDSDRGNYERQASVSGVTQHRMYVSFRCTMSEQQLRENKNYFKTQRTHKTHSRVRPRVIASRSFTWRRRRYASAATLLVSARRHVCAIFYVRVQCKLRGCTARCVNDTVANKLPPLPVLCSAVLIPFTLNYQRRHILFAKPENAYGINT